MAIIHQSARAEAGEKQLNRQAMDWGEYLGPSAEPTMRKVIVIVIALIFVLTGCSRPWQTSSVESVPPSPDPSYASPSRSGAYGSPPWEDASERARSREQFGGAPPPPARYSNEYGGAPRSLDPYGPDPYGGGQLSNDYDQASPSNPYGPVSRRGPNINMGTLQARRERKVLSPECERLRGRIERP